MNNSILKHLLPAAGLRVVGEVLISNRLTITLRQKFQVADCPACGWPSSRIHGWYHRHVEDFPCGGLPVTFEMQVRRYRCDNPACCHRTFAESFSFVTHYQRQTSRLQNVLWQLALALGGAAGVRLARHLHFSVSAETLLRRLKNTDCNPDHAVPISPPTVIGIDEWAFKRGHHYGTILVDVAQRQVLDLLPDRDATTVASWLSRYPTIRIVSRDRAGVYAQGIARGAPQAIQVADRWHLLKNLGEAVERVLTRLPA